MRIGLSIVGSQGPQALLRLRGDLRAAADNGFSSAWLRNIFGLDALTARAAAGSDIEGLEIGTAARPTPAMLSGAGQGLLKTLVTT